MDAFLASFFFLFVALAWLVVVWRLISWGIEFALRSDRRAAARATLRRSLRDGVPGPYGHNDANGNPSADRNDDGYGSPVVRRPGRHAIHRDNDWHSLAAFAGRRRAGRPNAEAIA